LIHQTALNDEGEIKCTATNRAGHVATRAKLILEGKLYQLSIINKKYINMTNIETNIKSLIYLFSTSANTIATSI